MTIDAKKTSKDKQKVATTGFFFSDENKRHVELGFVVLNPDSEESALFQLEMEPEPEPGLSYQIRAEPEPLRIHHGALSPVFGLSKQFYKFITSSA